MTRANLEGADAAQALGNNFIVYGVKNKENTSTTVYNYYNVNWKGDETNKDKGEWVYAEQDKNKLNTSIGEGKQTIKYWDYGATSYDFTAFTLGNDNITVTRSESNGSPTYTLKDQVAYLQSCFIADRKVITSSDFGNPIQFTFHSTGTKVGMSIYETIPGYSIKDIKFYNGTTTEGEEEGSTVESDPIAKPCLYANTECITENHATGTLTVTYNTDNSAKPELTEDKTGSDTEELTTKTSILTFSKFVLNADKEGNEPENAKYLGRTKGDATSTGLKAVTPCTVTDGLTLKVDYTLISTDGSDEEITVKGATATIPEKYTTWETNHVYNYIFHISEKTNGSTGSGEDGLHPIIFDAVVDENANGSTTTETTFDQDGNGTTTVVQNNQDANKSSIRCPLGVPTDL